MLPEVSLFTTTKADIKASIEALQQKFQQRRQIDLQIQQIQNQQRYLQRLDQQSQQERCFWRKIQAQSDYKYRSYIENKLAEDRRNRYSSLYNNAPLVGHYSVLKQNQDWELMKAKMQLQNSYNYALRENMNDLADQQLVQKYRDGTRTKQYISELDKYQAKVFGAIQKGYVAQNNHRNSLLNRQKRLQQQLAEINHRQSVQINQLLRKSRKQKLYFNKQRENIEHQPEITVKHSAQRLQNLILKQRQAVKHSKIYENDLKKTIKHSPDRPDINQKVFTRSPYGKLQDVKRVNSEKNSNVSPLSWRQNDQTFRNQDPTFRNNLQSSRNQQLSQKSTHKQHKQRKNSDTKTLSNRSELMKKIQLLKQNQINRNAHTINVLSKSLKKSKVNTLYLNGKPKNQKKRKSQKVSIVNNRSRSYSMKIQNKSKREINKSFSKVYNIQQAALKKIDNRLRCSECVFVDSKWRNCKHQIQHLHNTYDTEIYLRKQIKDKINQHPDILKKHKMVVQ